MELPDIPVSIPEFIDYVNQHPNSQAGVAKAVEPFKAFESKLREVYAQFPTDPAATANHLVPVFDSAPLTIRARDLSQESAAGQEKYLLSLPDELRRKHDSLATVQSLKEFKTNFNVFSESALVDLDWSNVVVAGSAVVTSLLPVDAPHNESKRALRSYYHEDLAPASDVDIFLYGLNEDQAIEKIKQIETKIRDSILAETTTIRTKNAITIVSEYPTRHVQIVLRLYKSVSEILTGFDVDCSCVAYDGEQVWASPRALAAFMTQINTIDLTRRSPSYENRLSKYSHRGFEVYWPAIDRTRIDPTIFERSFTRVQGLARVLVLEKLPHPNDRDTYLAQRREERGRPPLPWQKRFRHELPGNIKDAQPDDVAEWVEEDEVSNYHTVGIPYGPRYNAKKIEKLLFTKDLLLNAEWNRPKDRETKLHRHPAFFGFVNDVIHDCCGFCPQPTTDADLAAYEEESKIYIAGDLTFLKDDPGRQAIGSFNPITDDDWTEMAYVGNTTRLCQAIVDQDLEAVRDWFSSPEVVDVNRRDHTGRTPLHLATMCSTPEIVHCLIEHGARLVSRLYNGMTALHIAAHRGDTRMVKDILEKSSANEEEESQKEEARKKQRRAAASKAADEQPAQPDSESTNSFESDEDMDEDEDDEDEDEDMTEGSFVKVRGGEDTPDAMAENKDEPDIFDIDVLAWDSPLSPLHLAILAGHTHMIDLLIDEYGADVLLPVKILDSYDRKSARAAILTIVLALELPLQRANETVKSLISHGASAVQADMSHTTALHFAVSHAKTLILETLQAADSTAFSKACNFLAVSGWYSHPSVKAPIITAIRARNMEVVQTLLKAGAHPHVDLETFVQAFKRGITGRIIDDPEQIQSIFQQHVEQPITVALNMEMIDLVDQLVDMGEDVNTLPTSAYQFLGAQYWRGEPKALLDLVRDKIKSLEKSLHSATEAELEKPKSLGNDEKYLAFDKGTYQYWMAYHDLREAKVAEKYQRKEYEKQLAASKQSEDGSKEKDAAIRDTLSKLTKLEQKLVAKGGKSFHELHKVEDSKNNQRPNIYAYHSEPSFKNVPYETKISFRVADLTPEKNAKYIKLFEAAWTGDAATVRSLCLEGSQPLAVAISDYRSFTPFSIAVLRGHLDLATLIVEIATAQYQPEKKSEHYHYTIQATEVDDDDSDYSESVSSQDSREVKVLAQLVNDTFTIDDAVALAENVKSRISPETLVKWTCNVDRALAEDMGERRVNDAFGAYRRPTPWLGGNLSAQSWSWFHGAFDEIQNRRRASLVRYAIFTNDMVLLKFLIKTGTAIAANKDDEDTLKVMTIDQLDFEMAIRLGRVEMVSEMIRTTGYGLPLQKMFQTSGVKLDEKPQYYQGLTVHGKKRQDWADASRKGVHHKKAEFDLGIPLLVAAFQGNLESTEYFLSDAPLHRYLDFAHSFRDDKHIRALAQARGGLPGSLTTWLGTHSGLALHLAILSSPNKDGTQPTFDYLLEKMPESLELRSADGSTPLHVAFQAHRYYAAKKLIAAGANQATRDEKGRNILHSLLDTFDFDKPALLRSVLGMLDQSLVGSLLLERCTGTDPGGLTPIALYLKRINSPTGWEESVRIILSCSLGKDLEKMDGAGDYPLHSLVRRGSLKLVQFLVEYRPGLLHWENATGMTPLDVAMAMDLGAQIEHPPELVNSTSWSVETVPAKDFAGKHERVQNGEEEEEEVGEAADDGSGRSINWQVYRLVESLVAKYPAKRKLVGLHDANEVAKRLAVQQQKKNAEMRRREKLGMNAGSGRGYYHQYRYQNQDSTAGTQDEISQNFAKAMTFIPWDEMVWRMNEAGEKDIEHEYTRNME
ncbi:uncharacterized protein PV06_07247 [Exophiala oligosperma]|uniref:Ankyrin repeat protein n=1 Tax=Exophiala oligosperma TaxID=215243 RepID=A0A0D2BW74_9EURO|nr:uncharacterized protein PV06_07247 [Exophiala oligosperma]KIW41717.1 hypothetical protein PV06_07247 [Exophiala oligosperma]